MGHGLEEDTFSSKPFAPWLEEVVKGLFDNEPVSIAMEVINSDGQVSTAYWMCSPNDRALMVDAMRDDSRLEWLLNNREEVLEILNGEGDDEDGLCEPDTEADS